MIKKLKAFELLVYLLMNIFCTTRCKSAKKIWKMLEVTHEGIVYVRRARKHTLVSEYEAF